MDQITTLFSKYHLELSPKEIELFTRFLDIFQETNAQINLSAIRERDEIIEKHFIDSLLVKQFCSLEWKILDLGTGWGFPGIPLKIVDEEDAHYTLVDSVGKKVKVVNDFISYLWLTNITAIQARAEELGQDKTYRESYNIVLSRATAYLPTLLEYSLPLLSLGGLLIAYKLKDTDEIKESTKALEELGGEIIANHEYELLGQKRVFIFVQKVAPTPKQYPRRIGDPLKFPL